MRRYIIYTASIVLLLFNQSCIFKWLDDDTDNSFMVYKTEADYSENVSVVLSNDKSRITSFYGPGEESIYFPIALANGYYLHKSIDANSAFLSISEEEYLDLGHIPSTDSLYSLIIDDDPFLEFYKYDGSGLYTDNGIDTIHINQLIINNNLEKYFKRVK